ncbi:MAG: hypothetical protein ACYTFY_01515 [Planctomycetota bacterium]|jgi:hypothetical protein
MNRNRFSLIILLYILSVNLSTCISADNGSQDKLFDDIPDLSIAVRINSLKAFGSKFDKMLNSIAPGWTLPGAVLRPMASYLKTPDFSALQNNTFFEFLIFKSPKGADHFSVAAFKVENSSQFLRQIESFSAVTSNALGGSITHFKEEHRQNSDFYIGVVHNNLILFSHDKGTLEYAYTLYSRLSGGVIRSRSNDINIYLHCKRILISHAYLLDTTYASLVEDISSDLSADASQETKTSFKRLVGESLSEVRNLANQFISANISFTFADSSLSMDSAFEIEDGSLALMVKDSKIIQPSLIKYLPNKTIMCAWKSVSKTGFNLVSARVAALMSFLIDGAVDAETKDDLEDLKNKVLAMQPIEAVVATVASPVNPTRKELIIHGNIKPDRIAMVKVGRPYEFNSFIKKIPRILGPRSSFVEQLERNGITVEFSYEDRSSSIKGVDLHYLKVSVSRKQDDSSGKKALIKFSGEYYLALNGNIMLVATGPEAKMLIRVLIDSTKGGRSFKKSDIGRNTLALFRENTYSSIYMLDPLNYIESAAMAYAKYGQAYSVGGKPHKTVLFARQFREVSDVNRPFVLTFNHVVAKSANLSFIPRINGQLTLPYPAIRSIIKAILEPDTE